MKTMMKTGCLLLVAASLAGAPHVLASGSYCVCVTKPPAKRAPIDRDQYDLGQKIFNGRVALASSKDETLAKGQQPKLDGLQALLPKRTAKKKNLSSMAGLLSEEQLTALEYYVQKRYGKSK